MPGPSLAGYLVAGGDVNDVDRQIRQDSSSCERSAQDEIDSIDTKPMIAIDKYGQLKYERRQAGFCVLNKPRRRIF
jgi:hypothetical protein